MLQPQDTPASQQLNLTNSPQTLSPLTYPLQNPFQQYAHQLLQPSNFAQQQQQQLLMSPMLTSMYHQQQLQQQALEKSPSIAPCYFAMNNSPLLQPSLPAPAVNTQSIAQLLQQQSQQQQLKNIIYNNNLISQFSPQILPCQMPKKEENLSEELSTNFSLTKKPSPIRPQKQQQSSIFSQENSTLAPSTPTSNQQTLNASNTTNLCQKSLSGVSPDRNNEWVKYFQNNRYIQKIFPQNFSDFSSLFLLQNSFDPLQIRLRFPTKEQFLQKAEKLHKKKRSKFHNKNKLFFISIIKIFKKKQVQKFHLPGQLYQKFFALVHSCRIAGRKMANNKISKTDLFNHSHYNLLFLTLNPQSIDDIAKNDQDYKIHLKVFGIDLREKKITNFRAQKLDEYDENLNPKNSKLAYRIDELYYPKKSDTTENQQPTEEEFWEYIQYINFLKICVYQVVVIHLKQQMIGNSDQQSEEREYDYRAFKGILDMIKGNSRDRF